MSKLFSFRTARSNISASLTDKLYEAQRLRLVHASAAEHHQSQFELCVKRTTRLKAELAELMALPAVKQKWFGRMKIETILQDQLHQTQKEYFDNASGAEHHAALAEMYHSRIVRLRSELTLTQEPLGTKPTVTANEVSAVWKLRKQRTEPSLTTENLVGTL